jgi:hypothetical protein
MYCDSQYIETRHMLNLHIFIFSVQLYHDFVHVIFAINSRSKKSRRDETWRGKERWRGRGRAAA